MTDAAGGVGRLGIGWAQGTTREAPVAEVLGWLSERFGPAVPREHGLQWYGRAWKLGEHGVVVGDRPRSSSSDPGEVYVVIPQGALDPLGWDGQVAVLALLESLRVRLSRVDVYYDDLARHADPEDVLAAMRAGNARTRVKAVRWVGDFSGGMTTYLGSREGECMVRVYRKWAESGDPGAGVRWEMEAKGERAPIVADFVRGAAAPAVAFFGLLRAFVDFVDREDGARGDRAPMLAWWAMLIGSAGLARLAGRVVVDSLARKVAWLRRQVVPTLALVFAAYGSAGLSNLIDEGWPRARWELVPALSGGPALA